MKKYLIFIPVYNEEKNVREVLSLLKKYSNILDILVIDDGSTDNTSKILNTIKDINQIRHEQNKGYGSTLIEGFNHAIDNNYHYVITMDSDKQHQPKEVEKFIKVNEKTDFDILSGSRYLITHKDSNLKAPEERRKVNQRVTKKINNLTGYRLTDAFCGFKLYKTSALKKLNPEESGYGMPLQLWMQAWKNKLTVKEIPVELIYLDRNKGTVNAYKNLFRRYRYYLEIINKEKIYYENISSRSAS
jgi:dolichol-phosphate mannosyltransferase